MSIRTIEVPTYNRIPHLPDIRQMQQRLCDKIESNFSKKELKLLGMSPVTVDWKGPNILLPLPTLVTQVLL